MAKNLWREVYRDEAGRKQVATYSHTASTAGSASGKRCRGALLLN
jgi:hypothetical protein